jgi:L-fuconolactonase
MNPTIDAHQHFLDPARYAYPWLTSDLAPIDRRFGPDDLAPELAATGIGRSIAVQTISDAAETRELLAVAATTPFLAGVIGWVDLTALSVADTIDAMRAGPGGRQLLGVRHQVHDEPDPDWLLRSDVARGLSALEAAGLTYDLLIREREMPAALAVARARPSLRFVIDHLGKPPLRSGDLGSWALGLRDFGGLDNVWCKLSGLVTEADWRTWQTADLATAVDLAVDVFGPSRLMFGSDWPVSLLAASYAQVAATARELVGDLSDTERAAIFGGTAEAVYRPSVVPDRI